MTEPTKEAVDRAKQVADMWRSCAPDDMGLVGFAITLRDALTASEAREAALREALHVPVLLERAANVLNKMLLYATEYPKDSHVIDAKEMILELRRVRREQDAARAALVTP